MSVVCKLTGHAFQETWLIREADDFFEVEDGHYCRKCGIVVDESGRNGLGRNGHSHHSLPKQRPVAGTVQN